MALAAREQTELPCGGEYRCDQRNIVLPRSSQHLSLPQHRPCFRPSRSFPRQRQLSIKPDFRALLSHNCLHIFKPVTRTDWLLPGLAHEVEELTSFHQM